MRIVAGEFKGRVINSPSEKTTRPTTDRVRESIFSSVYSRIDDLSDVSVLDAFAGSGALGIEALSRGAMNCVFFEQDRSARRVLEENIESLGLHAPMAEIKADNTFDATDYSIAGGPFGLVLLDPPYAYEASDILGLLDRLSANGDLADGCVIVYEHALANKQAVVDAIGEGGAFSITGQKKYGKIGVTYLKYRKSEE